MTTDFVSWLEEKIAERGLRPSDVAREGGVRPDVLSRILNRERNPGPDSLLGISKALDMQPEIVFRKAGLLPERAGIDPQRQEKIETLIHLIEQMKPEDQEEFIEQIRALAGVKIKRGMRSESEVTP